MQKNDWLKDVTPEEAEAMRKANWDLEDVDLDPIALRYVCLLYTSDAADE